jgi:hypothetical protein
MVASAFAGKATTVNISAKERANDKSLCAFFISLSPFNLVIYFIVQL